MKYERWKAVPGYEGYYEVSNLGRVRSLERRTSDGSRRGPRTRKLVWAGPKFSRYLTVTLSHGDKVRCFKIHTLVLSAFRGSRPPGYEARHLNGQHADNRLRNLVWGTPRQNGEDRIRHGTQHRGERTPGAKLAASQVRAIRRRSAAGETGVALATAFKVSTSQIGRIVRRLRWAHV